MTKGSKLFQWIQEKKQYLLIGAVILGIILYHLLSNGKSDDTLHDLMKEEVVLNNVQEEDSTAKKREASLEQSTMIKVDVKGAVSKPGVYTAQLGERVIDLVERAGGFLDDADQTKINLSQKVSDEMVIYVPIVGEDVETVEQMANFSQPTEKASNSDGKVNINHADSAMLQTLPGIGAGKAEAIIEYRETNGPFQTVEDLMNVSGIGEKTFEKLKDSITIE